LAIGNDEGNLPVHTIGNGTSQNETTILARVLGNNECRLPIAIARYILTLAFGERDKARMHDLAARNQEDALTSAEKEELFAYAKAGTLLSIRQCRARRDLGVKGKKRTTA
jgi:hypothetical protein